MFLVSGTIADSPKRDSKMSVPAVITAVAETLDPFHKLGKGTTLKLTTTTIKKSKRIFRYGLSLVTF
jgi:hypothetical protein